MDGNPLPASPQGASEPAARPLRVVHTIGSLAQEASGPSYAVRRLCEAAAAAGVSIDLATVDHPSSVPPPSYARLFPPGIGPSRLGRSPAMRQWLEAQAQAGQVDVLHAHGMWQMHTIYPGAISQRYKLPLVVSPHGSLAPWAMAWGSPVKRVFWPLVQKPVFEQATCLHATAINEYADIRQAGFRQPVAIIPLGIDLSALAPRASDGARTLLFLGRLHPVKGLETLLPVWAKLEGLRPDWRLSIVGHDNGSGYEEKLKGMAQSLGLKRVSFDGPKFGADKFAAFRAADLYVLPTHTENFGVTVAEALAQETPVVVTHGAPWSGLEGRGAGWWIPLSEESLFETLAAATLMPQNALRAMGAKGREWMNQDFDWKAIGCQTAAFYRWLLDDQANPASAPACVRFD